MRQHKLDAYIDCGQRVVFCSVCSADTEATLAKECPGTYIPTGRPRPVEENDNQPELFGKDVDKD